MLKLETIQKTTLKMGLNARVEKLTGGGDGLFISLEDTEYSSAGMAMHCKPISREVEAQLFKYLSRYNVKFEYRGNYTSIFIKEDKTA